MARGRGKKALYEVIGNSQKKAKSFERVNPKPEPKVEPVKVESPEPENQDKTKWRSSPKWLQFNAGRVEMSIRVELAIAAGLALIVVCLGMFRLGQIYYQKTFFNMPGQQVKNSKLANNETASANGPFEYLASNEENKETGKSDPVVEGNGSNRIVISQYQTRKDLEPVQQHFASYGIETFIEERSSGFFLLTKDTYDNPNKPGTDGYLARKKIVEVGAKYIAPKGYETFGARLFSDAYGEKVK